MVVVVVVVVVSSEMWNIRSLSAIFAYSTIYQIERSIRIAMLSLVGWWSSAVAPLTYVVSVLDFGVGIGLTLLSGSSTMRVHVNPSTLLSTLQSPKHICDL